MLENVGRECNASQKIYQFVTRTLRNNTFCQYPLVISCKANIYDRHISLSKLWKLTILCELEIQQQNTQNEHKSIIDKPQTVVITYFFLLQLINRSTDTFTFFNLHTIKLGDARSLRTNKFCQLIDNHLVRS